MLQILHSDYERIKQIKIPRFCVRLDRTNIYTRKTKGGPTKKKPTPPMRQ